MNALDAVSAEILELVAQALGNDDRARRMAQKAYDLGRADGRVEQVRHTTLLMVPANRKAA